MATASRHISEHCEHCEHASCEWRADRYNKSARGRVATHSHPCLQYCLPPPFQVFAQLTTTPFHYILPVVAPFNLLYCFPACRSRASAGTLFSMASMLNHRIPGFVNEKTKAFPRQLFAFTVDGIAIVIGSLLGCAPLTVYIESASGVWGSCGSCGSSGLLPQEQCLLVHQLRTGSKCGCVWYTFHYAACMAVRWFVAHPAVVSLNPTCNGACAGTWTHTLQGAHPAPVLSAPPCIQYAPPCMLRVRHKLGRLCNAIVCMRHKFGRLGGDANRHVCSASDLCRMVACRAGIREGGRTGITALVVAFGFFISLFFTPLIASIPPYATGPALVLVGESTYSPRTAREWQWACQPRCCQLARHALSLSIQWRVSHRR